MPVGIYGRMAIRRSRLKESVQVAQQHTKAGVEVTLTTRVFAISQGEVEEALGHAMQQLAERQGVSG